MAARPFTHDPSATAAFACVPPTRKYTAASGHAHASRMRWRARSHTSSVP